MNPKLEKKTFVLAIWMTIWFLFARFSPLLFDDRKEL
jgi:hypothetical protein